MDLANNVLLGCIAGDVIGSAFDCTNLKTKSFNLFSKNAKFSRATVMTMAVADALMNGKDLEENIWDFTTRYNGVKYNENFVKWLLKDETYIEFSDDNYSLVRIAPVGLFANNLKDLERKSRRSVLATHVSSSVMFYAQNLAKAIYLFHLDYTKEYVADYLFKNHKNDFVGTMENIRPGSLFYPSAEFSFYYGYMSFYNSIDFEDAIRNAISCGGGDSSSVATVAGALAMSYYGKMPQEIAEFVMIKLPNEFAELIIQFQEKSNKRKEVLF